MGNICAEAEPPVRIQQGADRPGRAGRKTRVRENCGLVERSSKTVPSDSCPFISVTVWVWYCSKSFPLLHMHSLDISTNRRHQSHWLRNYWLPISPLLWRQQLRLVSQICSSVCSASKDVYLYTVTTHTTRTHKPNPAELFHHFCQNQRRLVLNFSLFKKKIDILVWMSLLLDLHRQNPPHVLHVPELTVFIWALQAHPPTYPQPDKWVKAVHGPFGKIWA